MGYTCPATYNPADFYVQTLAVIPGLEDTSRSTVRSICDRFIVTSTSKQIDLLIQYETSLGQEMLELSTKNGHQPLGLWVDGIFFDSLQYWYRFFFWKGIKLVGSFSSFGSRGELSLTPIVTLPFTRYVSFRKLYILNNSQLNWILEPFILIWITGHNDRLLLYWLDFAFTVYWTRKIKKQFTTFKALCSFWRLRTLFQLFTVRWPSSPWNGHSFCETLAMDCIHLQLITFLKWWLW